MPLIDKITTRIESWGVECLSFAERLQLVQYVLQSIANYWCAPFILPKKVLKAVESRCNVFIWTGKTDNMEGTKVS